MRYLIERSGISRRAALIATGAAPFLATMIGKANAGGKVPQSAAHYQPSPKDGKDCDDCANFISPSGCKLVDGSISPKGWCRLWAKKTA